MSEDIKKFLGRNTDIQKNENNVTNNVIHNDKLYDYEMLGFEIQTIEIRENCIILCYKDYFTLKGIYNKLRMKSTPYQIQLRIIVTPLDELPFNLIVRFINRNKDTYCKGHIPKELESDECRERKFLSNIDRFDKVIYIGDVVRLE